MNQTKSLRIRRAKKKANELGKGPVIRIKQSDICRTETTKLDYGLAAFSFSGSEFVSQTGFIPYLYIT